MSIMPTRFITNTRIYVYWFLMQSSQSPADILSPAYFTINLLHSAYYFNVLACKNILHSAEKMFLRHRAASRENRIVRAEIYVSRESDLHPSPQSMYIWIQINSITSLAAPIGRIILVTFLNRRAINHNCLAVVPKNKIPERQATTLDRGL